MLLAGTASFYAAFGLLLVSPATGAFLKFWADRAADGTGVIGAASTRPNKPFSFTTQVNHVVGSHI